MNAQTVLQADYLDILYDNRNKAYGGYELRKHYAERIRKALLIVLGLCMILIILASITSKTQESKPREIVCDIPIEPVVLFTTPPAKTIEPSASKSTIKNPEMKIVDDNKLIEPPKTVNDIADKTPATNNTNGNLNGNSTNITNGNSNVVVVVSPPATKPVTWAEEMPEFNGDLNAFLQKQLQYPDKARDAGVDGKVNVQFIVNEDGSVSNTKIIRGIGAGCDEEAIRIINSMPKWKPGKQNGKAVKVYFTLPIRFVLQ
jgi:protein TonB